MGFSVSKWTEEAEGNIRFINEPDQYSQNWDVVWLGGRIGS
jgi:hypothetical protein